MASGKTKMAGVIGWPVAHSLSPRLHQYWLKQYGIDGTYVPLPVKPEDLKDTIKSLPKMGFRGVNLTIPHKELAMQFMDYGDQESLLIGAVNTLVVDGENKIFGMNTDCYGFVENIKPHMPQRKQKVVILGAGGAARAVCFALMCEGFSKILIINRTPQKAEALAGQFPEKISIAMWEKRTQSLEDSDLLVNCTSLGMTGKGALDIDLAALPRHALVTDIVYTPLMTPLLTQAKARGNPVVDGLGMLLHQAVPGFEAWFGVRPEVTEALRRHVLQ